VLAAALVAATAIALHRIVSSRPNAAVVVAFGAAVLLVTNVLLPLPTDTLGPSAAGERALREIAQVAEPGDTVMRLPADCDPAFETSQVFHHTAIVGCAGSFAADPWSKLVGFATSAPVTKLRCDRARYGRITTKERAVSPFGPADVAALRDRFGVRFLVVDRARLGQADCTALSGAVSFLHQYRTLGGDRRLAVVDLASLREGGVSRMPRCPRKPAGRPRPCRSPTCPSSTVCAASRSFSWSSTTAGTSPPAGDRGRSPAVSSA
jgi:hypothetical protein